MRLIEINCAVKYLSPGVILEGYGVVYSYDYNGKEVTDKRPRVLSLGKWKSPRGNMLMAGINLNYLSKEQTERLQSNLHSILMDRNLRRRVRKLRSIMPDIFNKAYRTFNVNSIDNVDRSILKFRSIKKDTTRPEVSSDNATIKPKSAPDSETTVDDVMMPQIDTPVDTPSKEVDREEPEAKIEDPRYKKDSKTREAPSSIQRPEARPKQRPETRNKPEPELRQKEKEPKARPEPARPEPKARPKPEPDIEEEEDDQSTEGQL